VSMLDNETVHRGGSSLLTVCSTDAGRLAKISFLHFQDAKPIPWYEQEVAKGSGYCVLRYGL
jgi:hypothetical protein